ncbi:hypothetical protein [Methylocella silvestris]|uniref:hypothetical protein n=1 Tax=Methylocella silvestris TaxID=199596 RepID=UPI00017269DE|nr:hypothetical protein [Methylocella silvestris]
MTYLLDRATTAGPVSGLGGTQLGYKFTRGGKTIVALWDHSGSTSAAIAIPSGPYTIYDWMGNGAAAASAGSPTFALSRSPIYIVY